MNGTELCSACAERDVSPLDDVPEGLRGLARVLDDQCVACLHEFACDWAFESMTVDLEETDAVLIYVSALYRNAPASERSEAT